MKRTRAIQWTLAGILFIAAPRASGQVPFVITSLSPNFVPAESPEFVLTVTGTGFLDNAFIEWMPPNQEPTPLVTVFVNATTLTATVPADLVATPGTVQVQVTQFPIEASETSNSLPFQILEPAPVIETISPSTTAAGSALFALTVTGANFLQASVVEWLANNVATLLSTSFTDAAHLTAVVPAALVAVPGSAVIRVRDPIGPVYSNSAIFSISPPVIAIPSIQSISPGAATASCTSGLQITVNGANFAQGAIVRWLRTTTPVALQTTFLSANQLTAFVPAGLLFDLGSVTVTVVNPGNNVSQAFPYTVTAAPLTLASLDPSSTPAGTPGVTITVTGTGFLPAGVTASSVAQWTAKSVITSLATQVLNRCVLTATVPANLVAEAGSATVAVFNMPVSQSSPQLSNSLLFAITRAPLAIPPAALPTGTVGVSYVATLRATGGLPEYRWSLGTGTLPDGLKLEVATGAITGIPTVPGTFNFTVQVTDREPAVATRAFSITVRPQPLAITTASLADGTVGTDFAQTLEAAGGVLPYTWSIPGSSLPPGLQLNPATGAITGKPTAAGSYAFTAQITDASKAVASKNFTIVVRPAIVITTTSLADGRVGTSYSQALAATGGAQPYTWSVSEGRLPDGLTLEPATGTISGTPTSEGTRTFTVQVTDKDKNTGSRSLSITVGPPLLVITTASPLPGGVATSTYSQALAATGGRPPYTWTIAGGALPGGITLDPASGALGGKPSAAGRFTFTARVTDSLRAVAEREYTIQIALPPAPSLTFAGVGEKEAPEQQPRLGLTLDSSYPLPLNGTVTLTFAPDTTPPVDDPAIVFPNNRRTMDFAIPAGAAQAQFSGALDVPFRTGTVAGTITLTLSLRQGETDITPSPPPTRTIRIDRLPPTLAVQNVSVVRTASGLEVRIVGYATPRQVTQAKFRFGAAAGASVQTSEFTVDVTSVFSAWYRDPASSALGSAFRYVQPFTVQGNSNSINSVTVTLSNAQGDSQPVTVNF